MIGIRGIVASVVQVVVVGEEGVLMMSKWRDRSSGSFPKHNLVWLAQVDYL